MPAIGTGSGSEQGQRIGAKRVRRRIKKHPKGVVAHRAKGDYKGAVAHSRHPKREAKLYKPAPKVKVPKAPKLSKDARTILKPSGGIVSQVTHAASDVAHFAGKAAGLEQGTRVALGPTASTIAGKKPPSVKEQAADLAVAVAPAAAGKVAKAGIDVIRAAKGAKVAKDVEQVAQAASKAESAGKKLPKLPKEEVPKPLREKPKVEVKRSPVKRVRERTKLRERPGKVGKYVRRARKARRYGGGALAVGPPVVTAAVAGVHGQNPIGAVTGKGAGYAGVAKAAEGAHGALPGVLGAAVSDTLNFPAQAVPAAYMVGKAGVEAAQGHPDTAKALWESYKKTGFLPKVVQGDPAGALKAFEKHPVFSALEVSGAYHAAGGAAGRALRVSKVRDPAHIAGGIDMKREYSHNPVTKGVQKANEARKAKRGKLVVRVRKAIGYVKNRMNHHIGSERALQRREHDATLHDMLKHEPGTGPVRDAVGSDIVSWIAKREIRSPKTWHADLQTIIDDIEQKRREGQDSGRLTKPELESISESIQALREAQDARPRSVRQAFKAAEHYVSEEVKTRAGHVEQGRYAEGQTEAASHFPWAMRHHGYTYGVSNQTKRSVQVLEEKIAATTNTAERNRLRGQFNSLKDHEQLIDPAGNAANHVALRALLKQETGSEHAGFIPSAPRQRNAHYQAANEPPTVSRASLTGAAHMRGSNDHTYMGMIEHLLRTKGIVGVTKTINKTGKEFGARRVGGKGPVFWTDTQEAYKQLRDPEKFNLDLMPGVEYDLYRMTTQNPTKAELEAVHQINPEQMVSDEVGSRFNTDVEGKYVAIPRPVSTLLREHHAVSNKFEKLMQQSTTLFKGTVLPTSPSYFVGNAIDNYIIRTMVSGSGPTSYAFGRRLLGKLDAYDSKLAEQFRAQFLQGTLYGSVRAEALHRTAMDYDWQVAHAAAAVLRAPGIRTLRSGWNVYKKGILQANARMEAQPQIAGFGKLAKQQLREAGHSQVAILRLQQHVVEDFANGMKNMDNAVHFGKQMEDMWGKWNNWSPSTRKFLQTYSPFGSWLYNASRLALWTLPTKHPVKAGIIAAMEVATSSQREAEGQGLFTKNPLPPGPQGGIPVGPGGKSILGVAHYTSFGIFDDPGGAISGGFLPQFKSLILAPLGVKYTGQQLVDGQGRSLSLPERLIIAGNSQIEAMVPLASWVRRIREQGRTSADTSTIISPTAKKYSKETQRKYGAGKTQSALDIINPFTKYDPSYLKYLRTPKTTHTYPFTPKKKSGGSLPLD